MSDLQSMYIEEMFKRYNHNVSFREFALICASKKDESEFIPNPIYKEMLEKAEGELSFAKNISNKTAKRLAHEDHMRYIKNHGEFTAEKGILAVKYGKMLAQVAKWEVPSAGYEDLKKHMIKKLEKGLDFYCNHIYFYIPEEMNGAQYRKELIEKAEKNIKYHQEEYAKGVKRAKSNYTLWVKKLVKSLPAE